MRNIVINNIGTYIPKNEVSNEYFIEHFRSLGMECESLMKHMKRDTLQIEMNQVYLWDMKQ